MITYSITIKEAGGRVQVDAAPTCNEPTKREIATSGRLAVYLLELEDELIDMPKREEKP